MRSCSMFVWISFSATKFSGDKKFLEIDAARARHFGNVFRFIDDLTAVNDCDKFERSFWEIYPPELELKKKMLVFWRDHSRPYDHYKRPPYNFV